MNRTAIFSNDRVYRYSLTRSWSWSDGPDLLVIGLNPSTADETKDDPTIRRCIDFANRWGYGGLIMMNLFAYRSTDPKGLLKVADPVGPENDICLKNVSRVVQMTIAAWGAFPTKHFPDRLEKARSLISCPYCLRVNKDGSPAHPLYIPKETQPIPYTIHGDGKCLTTVA